MGHNHFVLVVCSNNFSVWHRFRYTTAFTVYSTACDLEISFSFDRLFEITREVHFSIHVYVYT